MREEIERITVFTNNRQKLKKERKLDNIHTHTQKKRRNKKEDKVSKYTNLNLDMWWETIDVVL